MKRIHLCCDKCHTHKYVGKALSLDGLVISSFVARHLNHKVIFCTEFDDRLEGYVEDE